MERGRSSKEGRKGKGYINNLGCPSQLREKGKEIRVVPRGHTTAHIQM